MTEIRIYVEGGGDKESKAAFRLAFNRFFGALLEQARQKRIDWKVIGCGSRSDTFANFKLALTQHPNALVLLLADSESPVERPLREHLAGSDGNASYLLGIPEHQCHTMVELMEAWFLADPQCLTAFYGSGFSAKALPKTQNVEKIAKATVLSSLDDATRGTQKGKYHKTRHAPKLLERLSAEKVRQRAPHCDRLFEVLEQHLSAETA